MEITAEAAEKMFHRRSFTEHLSLAVNIRFNST